MNLRSLFNRLQPSPTSQNQKYITDKLRDDRAFWDMVVSYAEPENETEAIRAANVADQLLECRRERFPI